MTVMDLERGVRERRRGAGREVGRRRRVGYAEVAATVALVLAMAGGALAAGHYVITSTKEIKPSVLRHLHGARGRRGAVGPRGRMGARGITGNAGVAGIGISGIFGSGADGSQTITASTTLTRDMYYDDLTVGPGVTLNPGGFRVFVSGALTLRNGSRISRDGNDATVSGPAAGLTGGSLGGSAPGANQGLCVGGTSVHSLGDVGGTGASCPGGPTSAPTASVGGMQAFDNPLAALTGRTLDGVIVSGGAGGGGGSSASGNGGAGGGVVIVAARSVSVTGSAAITAVGGANSDDGGGGGGGVAVVVSTSPTPAGLTLSVAGGGSASHVGSAGFAEWLN
jgi:hypothetical protein